VPPGMIGSLIHPMIGSMIGADTANTCQLSAAVSDELRSDSCAKGITWEPRDLREEASPPPTPPCDQASGGGEERAGPNLVQRRSRQEIEALPDTEAAAALQLINVKPAQIIELAHMPCVTVEAAIADGRARPGIRDLAGWVVSLLRTHRDYGWKITPPAPAPDSPEDLRAAFARYAAEQTAEQEAEQHTVFAGIERRFDDPPAPEPADSSRSVVKLWNAVLATMQCQVSRPEFNTWIRRAVLLSIEHGIATIGVSSAIVKDGLENRYAGALREVIRMLVGFPIQLRFVIREQSVAARPVGEAQELSGPPPDPPEESVPTIAAQQAPASSVNHRPDWISAAHWGALPTLLRAALIGAILSDGAVQAVSPHLTRLIEMRYAHEVTALIAAAEDHDPSPAVEVIGDEEGDTTIK
jgi:DnaA N-terminal domain